jgi:outer membrane protein OmpA-like peptidoglycan-associated protein
MICLLAGAAFLPAQESPWYEDLFVEVSTPLHFAPPLLKDYIKLGFGFRGALGYEYRRFRFAIESSYSHFAGTDSLITQLGFAPLIFKFGYGLPLYSVLGLQADVSGGFAFSQTTYYPTEADRAGNKIQEDRTNSFMLGGRLYATVTPVEFLRVYAGGGIDVILEKEGPLPMPLLEIGLHFKPFVLARKRPEQRPQTETTQTETTGLVFGAIYFERNSISINKDSVPNLDEVGRLLQDNPMQKITLRAYYAPDGIERQVNRRNGDPALSAARAEWCARYLLENYGITADRITIEHRDAGSDNELYRSIEIILR